MIIIIKKKNQPTVVDDRMVQTNQVWNWYFSFSFSLECKITHLIVVLLAFGKELTNSKLYKKSR